ncbi:hypothetical protein [Piscinibacter sp.]|uniref:hypothetical protein n=1 Tax=Piscinibacter sp. TaxID=1903157 RepID=UPI002C9A313C|nr:hypothetical protein [Albitalea sp.]HUG21565.1 hypothetical protein [Albitalea sp.]
MKAPWSPFSALKCLLCTALLAAASARAEPACWAASVMEEVSSAGPIGQAAFRPLHAAMDTLEQMLRSNPGLLALPEVRLRFKREVMESLDPLTMPYQAVAHAQGFGPKTWGRGPCDVSPQAAERIGARAGISIFINTPAATLNRWLHDDELVTYLEGDPTPSFQGWPTYRECAVIGPGRRLPWIAVTVGEMLALYEREQQRRIADWDRRHANAMKPFDLAAAERQAEQIRPLNAQAADSLLLGARQRKSKEAMYHAQLAKGRQMLVSELDDLRATRAAMAPDRLAEPYRLGNGKHRLPNASDAGRPLKRIVKLDRQFPWDGRHRARIQLITVCARQLTGNPDYHPPMRDAVDALDFARLAALLN